MVLESAAHTMKVLNTWSITGLTQLTVSKWLQLLPFLGVLAVLGYLAICPFLPNQKQQKDSLINLKIQKENPKVVNEINMKICVLLTQLIVSIGVQRLSCL
uniref:Uncharacterized protein n=2 Tax=Canis lupus familiaris TaxID=9615 RepID=A0A8I3PMH8_CANLF